MFYFLNRIASSRITWGVVLFVLLALLIWFGGPKLSIDEAKPLATQTNRLLAIGILAALFLLLELFRRWRLARINRQVLHNIEGAQGEIPKPEHLSHVREGFTALCATLRERMGVGRRDKRYLYDLSWYLLLGESGSGRSTALSNSGLEFPIETTSGTRLSSAPDSREHCGWRVTDDAVFIDAPGTFVTQPDPSAAAEWRELLDCLKSARSRQPLNGVILTLPVERLLGESLDVEVADQMRQCLQDLLVHFSATLPVYVLVTKCDQIAGFVDFFSNLDADEREGPWGLEFPFEEQTTTASERFKDLFTRGEPRAARAEGVALAVFGQRYRDFIARLAEWVPTRLPVERQLDSRRRIFAFPQQMQALGEPLETVLRRIFGPSRFRREALLRGVYFCSVCQEGPVINSLMRAYEEAYDLQPPLPLVHSPRRDAAFFFKGLIRNVILPERHLAGVNAVLARRRLRLLVTAWTLGCVAVVGLLSSWWLASERAKQQVVAIADALDAHEAQRAAMQERPNFSQVALAVAPLGRSHITAEEGALQPVAHVGGFMLRNPAALAERMAAAYDAALHSLVRPAVLWDLGDEIVGLVRAGGNGKTTDRLRDLFRLYIGLEEIDHFDAADLNEWAADHARGRYPIDPEKQTDIIAVVGDAFDELDAPQALDSTIVAAARRRLYAASPAERIYARMKESAATMPEVSLASALDESATEVFVAAGRSMPHVQGYYTEPGFYDNFLLDAPRQIRNYENDWLSEQGGPLADDEQLFADLNALYARDYIDAWADFLNALTLQPVETPAELLRLLEALLASNSPLEGLIGVVAEHTVLPMVRGSEQNATEGEEAEGGGMLASLGFGDGDSMEQKRAQWPGTSVRRIFVPYHNLRDGNTGDLPGLPEIRTELGDLHGVISAVADASVPETVAFDAVLGWMGDPSESAVSGLRRAATPQPKSLRRILFNLSDQSLRLLMQLARVHLDQSWQNTVLQEYRRAISGRYPLNPRSATPIAPDDFEAFFAPDGTIDQFFAQKVRPFVETSGGQWEERSLYGHEIGFSARALATFRNARAIRDAFDLNGGGLSDLGFTIIPVYLDEKAMRVTVQTASETFSYRHEPPRRFRMKFADESASIGITDMTGTVHIHRIDGPWAWFRMFDHFQLRPTDIPEQFDLKVEIGGMRASFRIAADSTINPLALSALTDFECEESLQ